MNKEAPWQWEECRQELIHDVSHDFIRDIKTIFLGRLPAQKLLEIIYAQPSETKTLRAKTAPLYRITSVRELGYVEIIINRPMPSERPNIRDESIRFRFNNPAMGVDRIELGYSRTLRKGGTRSFTNNTPALDFTRRFIGQMQADFAPRARA